MITWLVHRFAIGAEWKTVESGAEEKTRQNISNIFKKCSSVRVITFLRQVFKCFWSSTSSRNVIVVYICANVWLCGVEPRKTTGTAFFYAVLWWTEFLADAKHFVGQVQVYDWSYNLTETSIQCKYLHLKLIENRNSCAHLQLFCCVVPREENEHCRSSTDFIDELLQLKSLQMRRNKKAGILKSLLEKFLPDRFRKPRTARICKPSWVFWR